MDDKKYYTSFYIDKATKSQIQKILYVLFTSDIDLTNISLNISEAFEAFEDEEEEESISEIIDELIDETVDAGADD